MSQQAIQQQPIVLEKPVIKKKASKALVPSIIFASLSIIASAIICIYGFMNEIGMGLENVVFAIASIVVLVYAMSKSSVSAILKGIIFIAVAAMHGIYYCSNAVQRSITILKYYFAGNGNGADCYFGFVQLAVVLFFAIYVIVNVIRSFMNAKKASMFMNVMGYFAVLFTIVCFVVDFASGNKNLFAFKFIPIDLGFITLVLADIFAVNAGHFSGQMGLAAKN